MTLDERRRIASTIDHSVLRPEATFTDVDAACEIGIRYQVASICCRPTDVARCASLLAGSDVALGTVIGFPHGAHDPSAKAREVVAAAEAGAVEFDMVINIGWLRTGLDAAVESDIAEVVRAADGLLVKVILENAYLTPAEIVRGCRASEAAGADYVKTSTGFAPSGATVDDVRLMRSTVSSAMKVKASGGIRTLEAARALLDAGCDRLGTSSTATILDALGDSSGG